MGESANFTWDDNKDRENRRRHGLPLVASEAHGGRSRVNCVGSW
jgi:uncharacterized DUF497 family protein